jgi:hypothetical protein
VQLLTRDLPPRSPRETLGGFVIATRAEGVTLASGFDISGKAVDG